MHALSVKQLYFKLPDNFNGDISDAFRLLADYHDEAKKRIGDKASCVSMNSDWKDKTFKEVDAMMFDQFLDCVEDDMRFVGLIQIGEWRI